MKLNYIKRNKITLNPITYQFNAIKYQLNVIELQLNEVKLH